MKLQRTTSLTAMLSFSVMFLTGVVLYVTPRGRIAHWVDWRLWGLSKDQWSNIHINMAILFILAGLLHIYYNWKPITSYLKNKDKQWKVFTGDFNTALVLTVLFVLFTWLALPPFSWVAHLNESIKDAAALRYGRPPYGHAELSSLESLTGKTGLDLSEGIEQLRKKGYRVDSRGSTLQELSRKNRTSPQQIYATMQQGLQKKEKSDTKPFGAGMGRGGGRRFAQLCEEYDLPVLKIIQFLEVNCVTAKPEMSMNEIVEMNDMSRSDLHELIETIVVRSNFFED
ncbi:DUF4405 domain-containing protein [Thermodesulfobacteriota bacterium]